MSVRFPLSKTKYVVEIAGMEDLVGWVKVVGIKFGILVTPIYAQHTQNPTYLPGKRHAGPLTLVRMLDDNPKLAEWADKGPEDPRNGSVILIDHTGTEKRRFNFEGGYVIDYSLSTFDANDLSEGTATETVVLAVENIRPA